MKREFIISVRIFCVLSLLLGIIYPGLVTLIGQLVFHDKVNGSLVIKEGNVIGSSLIGQSFKSSKYFHGRPSAVDYNGAASGGSSLGPSSKKLMNQVGERIIAFRAEEGLDAEVSIPGEMVLGSASGLDPHISIESACLQVKRISEARNRPESVIEEILNNHVNTDIVNVLDINLALDSKIN